MTRCSDVRVRASGDSFPSLTLAGVACCRARCASAKNSPLHAHTQKSSTCQQVWYARGHFAPAVIIWGAVYVYACTCTIFVCVSVCSAELWNLWSMSSSESLSLQALLLCIFFLVSGLRYYMVMKTNYKEDAIYGTYTAKLLRFLFCKYNISVLPDSKFGFSFSLQLLSSIYDRITLSRTTLDLRLK